VVAPATKPFVSAAPHVINQSFPTRGEATRNWKKESPDQAAPDPVAAGPAGLTDSSGRGRNAVTAEPLADPKIDVAKAAADAISPMNPKEIREFQSDFYDRSSAETEIPGGPFESRNSQKTIDNSPGAAPVTVRIAMGLGAAISLVDRTGAPLIISGIQGFSPAFSVDVAQTVEAQTVGTNVFSLTAHQLTGQGNVAIQIKDQPAPITFNVDVGRSKIVDSNVQMVAPFMSSKRKYLPGDRMEADATLPDDAMKGFLANVPPQGAEEVKVLNNVAGVRAWSYHNLLYVRTQYQPETAWFKIAPGNDGTAAYEMPQIPVVLFNYEGRTLEVDLDFATIPTLGAAKRTASN
jgi:hypothetical protein